MIDVIGPLPKCIHPTCKRPADHGKQCRSHAAHCRVSMREGPNLHRRQTRTNRSDLRMDELEFVYRVDALPSRL